MLNAVFSMRFLRRGLHIELVGLLGAILDGIVISILPVIWYLTVGGPEIPASYMLKGPLYIIFLYLALVINSLSIRPLFVATNAAVGVLGLIAHIGYLFFEGSTNMSADYVQHNIGTGVAPVFARDIVVYYIVVAFALFFFLRGVRNTVYTAVKNETRAIQLGRYFSPRIRDAIMAEARPKEYWTSEKQMVAVLFSDIRDFTEFSENKSPEEVVSFLREYHERMVAAIFRNDGTVDKFIGDGIMATFGTPRPGPHDTRNAVRAACDMIASLATLNQERQAKGLTCVKMGIGIHYGPVIVGNIGSEERLEFTVIGDTVNVASRLESATKEVDSEILISGDLRTMIVDDTPFVELGSIHLKGRTGPIQAFGVVTDKLMSPQGTIIAT